MSLKKTTGNMYPWVTHTHSHLGGLCPHKCTYCYVDSPRFGRPPKYQGELRLIEAEFKTNYGQGKTIFVENCNDLFAADVPLKYIERITAHCNAWTDNLFVWQTKNPARYLEVKDLLPVNSIFGATIESNRNYPDISKGPDMESRVHAMSVLRGRKFVTIEPILDFDVEELASCILQISPEFINIGADSKKHELPEPTTAKIIEFINIITNHGIEIREKHNLTRLNA